jgi:capsule polysaccharide export protein KpsE/RkpR
VANELVNLIVNEDDRARSNRATEAVRILGDEARDLEGKLEDTQSQIIEIARRPHDDLPTMSEQQKTQVAALASLRAELAQKMSVYSDAHPAVTSLKKRISLMEKTIQEPPPAAAQSKLGQIDDMEALKRQREAIEKRLSEANAKLATARLTEKMNRDQQSERLQVIEPPTMPQKPLKSNRLKIVVAAFGAALALGIGCALAVELINGSIRGPDALAGLVPASLMVSIPYIETTGDIIRARARFVFAAVCVLTLFAVLTGLAAAIFFHLPIEPPKTWFGLHTLASH